MRFEKLAIYYHFPLDAAIRPLFTTGSRSCCHRHILLYCRHLPFHLPLPSHLSQTLFEHILGVPSSVLSYWTVRQICLTSLKVLEALTTLQTTYRTPHIAKIHLRGTSRAPWARNMIDPNLFLSPTYVHTLQSWPTTHQVVILPFSLLFPPHTCPTKAHKQASRISKPSFTLDAISSIHPLIHPIHPGNAKKSQERTKAAAP